MSYISYAEFGRTEIYDKLSGKDKLQNEKIQKVNSLHHHLTQKNKIRTIIRKKWEKNREKSFHCFYLMNQ